MATVPPMTPEKVLFICTHNSARSQMAEGMLRAWGGESFEAFSAGTHAKEVRPEAVAVMAEIGIDISSHRSKNLDAYQGERFEWVITVCDQARKECPVFTGAEQTAHWGIDDPSEVEGTEADRMAAFRKARNELRNRVRMLVLTASREELGHPVAERIREQQA
jgi:arsenate reductase (thioredoxin)